MRDKVLAYIREHELLKPGDRAGVAVSGGADSVALLRVLLELRSELGIVLAVLHFNHQIRGADADADERFVAELAKQHGVEFHRSSMDVRAYAAEHKLNLETAGRETRYRFFESFLERQELNAVATGHTMDDQAETVLMRILRGAGTKGLGGIYPKKVVASCRTAVASIVRPLLGTRRAEVREYLQNIHQSWREDATNLDLQYTRNRIRHGLIPLIETRFQPTTAAALAQLAEVAREEENYWEAEIARLMLELISDSSAAGLKVNIARLLALHPAVQRRVLRKGAQLRGITLDFEHLTQLLRDARAGEAGKVCELPGGWVAVREHGELRFEQRSSTSQQAPLFYSYRLPIPGDVEIRETGRVIRAFLRPVKPGVSDQSLDPVKLGPEVVVRNWQPGDRLWLAHSKGPKKMKELLQERHVSSAERQSWPVVACGSQLAWARIFGASAEFQPESTAKLVVVIEEHILHPRGER